MKKVEKKEEGKTAFPIEKAIADLELKIQPGRYLIRGVKKEFFAKRKQPTGRVLPDIPSGVKMELSEIERRYYDDRKTYVIVKSGDPFIKPDGSKENMYDELDLVIVDFNENRPFPYILYKGWIYHIITNSQIHAMVGKLKDLSMIQGLK